MSDQNPVSNDGQSQNTEGRNPGETKEEYVSRKAYEEVTRDMHKFKSEARAEKAAKAEYEAKLKAIEEEKLAEQQRWKELFEKERQEKEELNRKSKEKETAYLMSVKKSALKQELGGKIRDEYLAHADLKSIEFKDDGTLNMDSVLEVANKFRAEHGELIPRSQVSDATNDAPPSDSTVSTKKKLDDLNGNEAYEMLKKMKPSSYTS